MRSWRICLDQAGQIALQVHSQREEVRNDDDVRDPARGRTIDRAAQIRLPAFEKGRLDRVVASVRRHRGHFGGHRAHRIIGGFKRRAMPEHDVAGMFHGATAGTEETGSGR